MSHGELAARAAEKIAKADRILEQAKTLGKDDAIKLLVETSDELMKFRWTEFTPMLSLQDAELAKLQDAFEVRMEELHRAWSNLHQSKN